MTGIVIVAVLWRYMGGWGGGEGGEFLGVGGL